MKQYRFYCISEAEYRSAAYSGIPLSQFMRKQYDSLDDARRCALSRSTMIFRRNEREGDDESPLIHVFHNRREIGTVITSKARSISGYDGTYHGIWRDRGIERDIPLQKDGRTG